MSTTANGEQVSYTTLAANMVTAHQARLHAEATRKAHLEARMALRAHYQTFDPFDVPRVEGNPTPAITHVHTRRALHDAMRSPR